MAIPKNSNTIVSRKACIIEDFYSREAHFISHKNEKDSFLSNHIELENTKTFVKKESVSLSWKVYTNCPCLYDNIFCSLKPYKSLYGMLVRFRDPFRDLLTQTRFIQNIAHGDLPLEDLKYFLEQDFYYLSNFSQCIHATCRDILSSDIHQGVAEVAQKFEAIASKMITSERKLHKHFLGSGIRLESIIPDNPCKAYVSFLKALSLLGTFEEAIAAYSACFIVYFEIGQHLHILSVKNNSLQHMIDHFISQKFSEDTHVIVDCVNNLLESSDKPLKQKMKKAFETAFMFECMFLRQSECPQYKDALFINSFKLKTNYISNLETFIKKI